MTHRDRRTLDKHRVWAYIYEHSPHSVYEIADGLKLRPSRVRSLIADINADPAFHNVEYKRVCGAVDRWMTAAQDESIVVEACAHREKMVDGLAERIEGRITKAETLYPGQLDQMLSDADAATERLLRTQANTYESIAGSHAIGMRAGPATLRQVALIRKLASECGVPVPRADTNLAAHKAINSLLRRKRR